MKNRFDLEQEILDCWQITDDLEMILRSELDEYALQKALIGLISLYEIKFQRTFDTLGDCITKAGDI